MGAAISSPGIVAIAAVDINISRRFRVGENRAPFQNTAPKKNAAAKMAPGLNVFLINIGLFINCAGMILDPNRFRRPIQVFVFRRKKFLYFYYN